MVIILPGGIEVDNGRHGVFEPRECRFASSTRVQTSNLQMWIAHLYLTPRKLSPGLAGIGGKRTTAEVIIMGTGVRGAGESRTPAMN
jgi:hypothetical protein